MMIIITIRISVPINIVAKRNIKRAMTKLMIY